MSLKAKIEAVIYASEEPVTLAQLAGLLGEEAQAELDAMAAQQPLLDLSAEPENSAVPEASEPQTSGESGDGEVLAEAAPAAAEDAEKTVEAGTEEDSKKVARQRERALREYFRSLLDGLIAEYANGDRGLEIREIAGGFRLATKPEYHDAVRGFVKSLKPPLKLSLQALETLAVVAYKQPVTAPEVSEIRGVDSGGVLAGLMTRKLVATAGRKAVIGRPILYKTTKEFLVRFGLKDIGELPSIEEFEKMAGELAADEPLQEEIPMEAAPHNRSEETVANEGGSPALNERNPAPESVDALRETVEELESDRGAGAAGPERGSSAEVEPMRDIHEAQADGFPSADEGTGGDGVEGQAPHGNAEESGA